MDQRRAEQQLGVVWLSGSAAGTAPGSLEVGSRGRQAPLPGHSGCRDPAGGRPPRSYRVIGSRTAPGPDGCPSGGKHTQFRRETGGRRGAGGRDDVGGRVALSRPYWPPAGGRATPAADRRPREKAIARPATGSGAASDSTGSGGRNQAARLSRSGRGLATVRICSKPVGSSVPDPGGGLCIRRSPAPGLFLV